MQSVKKRIISLCMSAALASSALTGLTVISNADDFDSPSDIPTTRPPAATTQGDIQNRDETTTHREKIIMGDEHAESDYEYNANDDGTASIERYTGADVETLVIPSSIDGYKITRIGGYTFCSLRALHSVTVSEGIKEIGSHAFSECPELKSVTFPNSIESIDSNAFDECPALEEINLPEKEIEIEHDAFDSTAYYNNPKNWDNGILYVGKIHFIKADPDKVSGDVTLRAGVYKIPNEGFKNCANLTGITIPDSVKQIGGEAFTDCASLKKVKLSKNLTKLFDSTFSGCSSLESIEIPDSVTDLGSQVFTDCTSLKTVKLSDALTSISHSCFSGCTALESIAVPSSVTFIGDECFEGCTALESIAIPDGVTELYNSVFENCTSLTKISLSENIEFIGPDLVNNTAYANNADNWTDGLLYIDNYLIKADIDALSGKVTVKNGTTLIASSAFYNEEKSNDSITEIILPDTLVSIGNNCFGKCTALNNLIIPNSVSDIHEYAFSGCSSLESIIIPSGVSYLGYNAFEDCTSLSEVTINASLAMDDGNNLFEYLFAGCTELKAINVNPDNETLASDDGVLFSKDRTKLILYPANRDADSYTIPDSVKEICGKAFDGAKILKSISMSDNVTEIEYSAFSYCEKLEKIKLSENITNIRGYVFSYCPDLTDIELGNNITYIADSAFTGTGFMNDESNWENGVLYLGKYLIKANSSSIASEYTVKDGTRLIAVKAFEECENLTSITFPQSLKNINFCAFLKCGLKNVTIPATVTNIGIYTFGYTNAPIIRRTGFAPSFSGRSGNRIEGFTITGYDKTAANRYADENGFEFISLGTFDCDHETTQIINESKAYCYHAGYTGDTMCSNCGVILAEGTEIPRLKHEYKDGYCVRCGSEQSEDTDIEEPSTEKPSTEVPSTEPSTEEPSSVTPEPSTNEEPSSANTKEEESSSEENTSSESASGIKLVSDSVLKLDEDKKSLVFVPSSTLGMTVAEFRKQIDGDITVALNDDALIANGTKITCGDITYILTVMGDVQADGKITAADARAILRISAKLDTADAVTAAAADLNSDGKVSSSEARSVLRFSARLAKTMES